MVFFTKPPWAIAWFGRSKEYSQDGHLEDGMCYDHLEPHYKNTRATCPFSESELGCGDTILAPSYARPSEKQIQAYGNIEHSIISHPTCMIRLRDRKNPSRSPSNYGIWFPLAYASLFVLSFVSALDIGDYPGAWSSSNVFPTWSSGNTYHTITSTAAFTVATTTIHHQSQNDVYQDRFFFAGIALGVAAGIYSGAGLGGLVLNVLPGAILASLVYSRVVHYTLPETASRHIDVKDGTYRVDIERDGMESV